LSGIFPSVRGSRRPAHVERVRDEPAAFWENRSWRFRAILEAGRFTLHDVVNDARIRGAVREQWRLGKILDEDLAVEGYIAYLEWFEAVTRGELPRPARPRRSLFSL
jgi:hypothetical protein